MNKDLKLLQWMRASKISAEEGLGQRECKAALLISYQRGRKKKKKNQEIQGSQRVGAYQEPEPTVIGTYEESRKV